MHSITRREAAWLMAGAGAGLLLPGIRAARAQARSEPGTMLMREILSSGEKLPVVGLGTWQVFDVEPSRASALGPVLTNFARLGGRLIDSSPMYGRAEEAIGTLVAELNLRDSLFFATKVWTTGRQAGIDSMERSYARLQTKRIDLMQVHNLVNATTHLPTMREWKAQRRLRYIGITHYESSALDQVERMLMREKIDFLQINYSLMEHEADERVLPLARERGVAVIANRPFGAGGLFRRVRGKPLPDFAREFEWTSWAQFFLKWIIAHPAVTCVIPATEKVQHLEENMGAGVGELPDAKVRKQMLETVADL